MKFLYLTEKYTPYFLPCCLIFSRSVADIFIVLISLLFLIKCFKTNDFMWLKDNWFKAFFLFFLYLILVNSPLSINSLDSFLYSISWLRWPIFALAMPYWILNTKESLHKLFISIIITLALFSILLFYQYFFDSSGILGYSSNNQINRLSVPFSNNVMPGRFIYFYAFILLAIYIYKKVLFNKKINQFFIYSVLLISFFTIFLTGERMSFLIFVSSAIFLIIGLSFNNKKYVIGAFVFLIVSIFLLLIFYFFDPQIYSRTVTSTIHKIYNLQNSDYGTIFKISFDKFLNNILFGSGLHQYKGGEPIIGYAMDSTKIMHAHNLPLNLLVETGIFGLILFYYVVYQIFKTFIYHITENNALFFIVNALLLYLCFFPFHTHFSLSHNWINANIWFTVGIILSLNKFHERSLKNN